MVAAAVAAARVAAAGDAVAVPWAGETVRDLPGTRTSSVTAGRRARWATFLLERSGSMSAEKLTRMFTGFCAVSGSPITPSDYNRYQLELDSVAAPGERVSGFMHYCCWPCVCDTQDFIKVDTKTVTLRGGESRQFHFAVIGNPCDDPAALRRPFVQPFDGRSTTLAGRRRVNATPARRSRPASDGAIIHVLRRRDRSRVGGEQQSSAPAPRWWCRGRSPGGAAPQPGRMTTQRGSRSNSTSTGDVQVRAARAQLGHGRDLPPRGDDLADPRRRGRPGLVRAKEMGVKWQRMGERERDRGKEKGVRSAEKKLKKSTFPPFLVAEKKAKRDTANGRACSRAISSGLLCDAHVHFFPPEL